MSAITVLPSAVADQIAAGEVVERPASVVKELVENAVDAGATSVDIIVKEGGRALVRVSDDGCGMDALDAVLSLARHGTSKIRSSADLADVRTFGFRGEALPAICSVSKMEIETATADGAGTRVSAVAGGEATVSATQRRRGTTVTVEDLFFNTPARSKFLRGSRSEWRAISDMVSTLSLARRDIRFEMSHDGRRAFSAPPARSMRERLGALWGAAYADALLDVDDVSGAIHVSGLVERPANVATTSRRTFLAVNRRAVREPALVRAAEAGYRSTIPAGTRPSIFLEVTVAAGSIDVNVHPAKAEIRFQDRWTVERAVERAVRRALGNFESGPAFGRSFFPVLTADPVGGVGPGVLTSRSETSALDQAPGSIGQVPRPEASSSEPVGASGSGDAVVPPLTQIRRTYIMFEHEAGVVLIDQHSAHERVLYETFMRQIESGGATAQRLLIPFTVSLAASELDAFEINSEYFDRLGFEIEPFGGNALIVHSVPTPHPRFDAERCLRDTLSALVGDRLPGAASRHERLIATVACKAAVKAGDALSPSEMHALFVALRDTELPAHDVHGRATIVQLSWSEVERRFGRT